MKNEVSAHTRSLFSPQYILACVYRRGYLHLVVQSWNERAVFLSAGEKPGKKGSARARQEVRAKYEKCAACRERRVQSSEAKKGDEEYHGENRRPGRGERGWRRRKRADDDIARERESFVVAAPRSPFRGSALLKSRSRPFWSSSPSSFVLFPSRSRRSTSENGTIAMRATHGALGKKKTHATISVNPTRAACLTRD